MSFTDIYLNKLKKIDWSYVTVSFDEKLNFYNFIFLIPSNIVDAKNKSSSTNYNSQLKFQKFYYSSKLIESDFKDSKLDKLIIIFFNVNSEIFFILQINIININL